ncbi:asparaginase [Pseudomonas sp. dw_358]|uniref:asparaginase n=1 Tax=Pseudomonas sp. dw_358 TaxID=2720083 RepID=UPI001BD5813A|nr:asparaginase [Pseudomonas sp. dw_358]
MTATHIKVLYTGGTIGMQASANGLAPASGFEARMRAHLHPLADLQWSFRELLPLIDSANMTPAYWQRLRAAIVEAVDVECCDGVLVLHGTDTLAYSAAAMAFQLLGVTVPVLFTGSMLPAGVAESDAWENLDGALRAFAAGVKPGVQLFFHGELLAPTRCAKIRSFGRHPFARLKRNSSAGSRSEIPAALHYRQPLQLAQVAVLPLVPGYAAQPVAALIASGVQGLVLECFGSGTGPSDDPAFLAALQTAKDLGVVVVAVTQCHEGGVELDIYEAGSRLREVGVVSGGGMTREAALAKLHALLGASLGYDEVRRLLTLDLCGELA